MKKLVIKESRWLTGENIDEQKYKYSYLYRTKDRKMCCLGFLARDCGYKINDIRNYGSPAELFLFLEGSPDNKWPKGLLVGKKNPRNSVLCNNIIDINDDKDLTKEKRKEKLIPLFKKLGYKLEFVK